jgi:hypothetical protein
MTTSAMQLARPPALPWPLPALAAWALAWAAFALATRAGLASVPALLAASALGAALAWALPAAHGAWRRVLVAAGFPLSALLLQGALMPAWTWLLPLAALALAYPRRAWRDAPWFPTPTGALDPLGELLKLPSGALVLDAGCGLGHGLAALHRAWPQARVQGVEFSWPLRWLAALRCPYAQVRQGDMWAGSWQDQALVYLFQRPESMPRAWAKACAEMRPGRWLVSLEFPVPGVAPFTQLPGAGGRAVWVYRVGATQPVAGAADKGRTARAPRGTRRP